MSEIRDTLFRYLAMLQLIPRSPGRISTPVLLEKLKERGFQIDARSLQRDLRDKLALHFPLTCDNRQRLGDLEQNGPAAWRGEIYAAARAIVERGESIDA